MAEYNIGKLYEGSYSSLDSSKYASTFPNYGITAGSLGLTTDPRTANIMKDFSSKIASGVKSMELEFVSPEVFDAIPNQQLDEVRRQAKLAGVDVSVHGPVIDTVGMNQQGFSELNREASEKRIIQTLERSHRLDDKGNIFVNFHSSEGIPGSEFKDLGWGKEGKREFKKIVAVNRESGKLAPLEEERLYYPALKEYKPEFEKKVEMFHKGEISEEEIEKVEKKDRFDIIPLDKGKLKTAESRVDNINVTEWDNSISQLIFNKERADEILQKNQVQIAHLLEAINKKEITEETLEKSSSTAQAWSHYQNARLYLEDTQQHTEALFHKAYKYGSEGQKKVLSKLSDKFREDLEKSGGDPIGESKAIQKLLVSMKRQFIAPKMYVPVEEFALDQSSKTFGNAAFENWKKFKDTAPVLNIENPPAGFAMSTGEDLREIVKESRKKFIERAVEEGISKREAENQAEKLIGATWDVGHINMLRKQGFGDKDIIKETEKIAPFVKHVHLSDNFGFEHTELPMGMGNVPMKEIMKKLGKKGFEAKKIIEAAHWWQHFQTSPVQQTMEEFGSPVYSDGVGPSWNSGAAMQGAGYFSGYGMMLPPTNYETFGGGFSRLPAELGGQRPGQGNRMSGNPME